MSLLGSGQGSDPGPERGTEQGTEQGSDPGTDPSLKGKRNAAPDHDAVATRVSRIRICI